MAKTTYTAGRDFSPLETLEINIRLSHRFRFKLWAGTKLVTWGAWLLSNNKDACKVQFGDLGCGYPGCVSTTPQECRHWPRAGYINPDTKKTWPITGEPAPIPNHSSEDLSGHEFGTSDESREALRRLVSGNYDACTVVPMLLFCPNCEKQHIDEATETWSNPPHRSHLCHFCGWIWRPSDICTTGVAELITKGTKDRTANPREVNNNAD